MSSEAPELKGPDLEQGILLDALKEGEPLLGHAGGEAVVVVKNGSEIFATAASCTHYGGPMAEGLVVGDTIRCPWHHACFSLRTGEVLWAAALTPLACYDVERQGSLVKLGRKRAAARKTLMERASLPKRVVLAGAGAASAACAEMLRAEGYVGAIVMVGAEEPGPVDRPNLSKDFLAGSAPEEWTLLGSAEHYRDIGVELLPNDPLTELDVKDKSVLLQSKRRLSFDALLFATGAEPRRLDIPGADLGHVRTLRSLGDSKAIIELSREGANVVIVGASFIGLEVAAALRHRGAVVHVVAPDRAPLASVLGPELSAFVQQLHVDKGVVFHLERKPVSIDERGVTLDDGSQLAASLVVLGVGVQPRTKLAEKAGLAVDNGIVVNEKLETSVPGIYAAGDVARYPDVGGEQARIEHWVVAERQGQAVAKAMLQRLDAYRKPPFFWSAHYDAVINYVGYGSGWDRLEVHGNLAARDALVAYFKHDHVVAVATLGRDRARLQIEAAMELGDRSAVRSIVAAQ